MEINNNAEMNVTNITVSAWIYPVVTVGDRARGIITKDNNSNNSPRGPWGLLFREAHNNKLDFEFQDENGVWHNLFSNSSLSFNTWYYVAASYDGNTIKLYIDGELDKIKDIDAANMKYTTNSILIGTHGYDLTRSFNGKLDEIYFWNIALSEEEIQANMYSELTGSESGLVGYWNFNAGSGTTLYDHSGNQNHGTINGGATWVENIYGCTDSYAENYNSDANWDDGSCTGYPDNGDYSLSFDGVNDYVYVEDIQLAGLSSYTIQNKLSFNSNPNTNRMGILGASEGSGNTPKYAIILNSDANNLLNNTFFWHQSTNLENNWLDFTTPSLDIYADYDFIFIKQNNEYSLYINGILQTSKLSDFETPYVNSEFRIGSDGEGWTFLNGNMDELLIWDRVLSEEEISGQDYSNDGLIANWRFDAGIGDTLYDHSGNQNHGTIYGATWVEIIYGCTDELACNHNPEASWDDSSCIYNDLCGECGGDNSTCTTITDIDDNMYGTVQIGDQLWMRQNLNVIHYNNGDEIPNITNNGDWSVLSTGAYGDYDNNPTNSETYGRLYNWYAVDDNRGLCIEGWHVPTDGEWMELEKFLGMSEEEANSTGSRGTDEGSKLAGNSDLWNDGDLENNSEFGTSGFNGIPAGFRYNVDGIYYNMGNYAYFWSSSGTNIALGRLLTYDYSTVNRSYDGKQDGFSIRCLQDDIEGCIDPNATNYDETANVDDGSCTGSPVNALDFRYAGELEGQYYYLSNNEDYWVDAASKCNLNNGYLVSISSEEENQFISSIHNNEINLIGFSDDGSEGQWYWTSGEEVVYVNWESGEPNNIGGIENYGVMNYSSGNGKWNDANHTQINYYTLEFNLDILGCTDPAAENYDETANVDDGSCTGNPDNGDYSLSFDGVDDIVELPYQVYDGLTSITLMVWFNAVDNQSGYSTIVHQDNPGANDLIIRYAQGNENFEFGFSPGISTDNEYVYPPPSLNQWHHIALSWNGNLATFYLDGEQLDSAPVEGIISGQQPVYIGNSPIMEAFLGEIDDVQYWNIALTQVEIQSYMSTPPIGDEDGLVAYYKFNAGEGTTLNDNSGNGNHGTINGAEWVENIYGCTDGLACNHNPEASWDDSSCIYNDLCGECGGDNSTCTIISDIDGNEYGTIEIGDQLWMRQNLKVTQYKEGSAIPTGLDNDAWGSTAEGAYAVYDDDPENAEIYGNLYNWYTVNDERGICPAGFHIPSDEEYKQLEMYLGMTESEANNEGWRGTNEGSKLAGNANLWNDGEMEQDAEYGTSDFNGLPSGMRDDDNGQYMYIGDIAYIWSSSNFDNELAWYRVLKSDETGVNRHHSLDKQGGLNARCVENAPGCTDSYADNYDDTANWDDGSCAGYPDNGDYSLSFDGENDWIGNFNNDLLRINGDLTIEFDVFADEIGSGNPDVELIISYYDDGGASGVNSLYAFEINTNGYLQYFHEHLEGQNELFVSDIFLRDGNWHNIIVSRNIGNKTVDIYDNSNLINNFEYNNNPDGGEDSIFRFGSPHNSYNFTGLIDNIRIYNESFGSINQQCLVSDFRFNAGIGDTLYDHSGNGNHGTIHGAQWAGCTDASACNFGDFEVEDDGSCWYAEENYDCEGNCLEEFDCNGICGGGAVMDECENCGGDGYIANCLDNDNCDDMDCNGNCGGEAYLDDCDVCSAGMSGHSPNSDIDCNGDCAADTPISCEDTTGNSQCGNATEDDCEICSGGNSGHIANSDMDECSVCFGDNFAELCIDTDDCSLMDCNGDCDGESSMDNCNVCSEGNTGHPFDSDIDCDGECFGIAIVDSFDTCCLDPDNIDVCGECGGNDYDLCDGDGDSDYNINDWGYGAHGFGDSIGILVEDIPEDQGGRVYITFYKSFFDTDTLRNTESYQIERLDEGWVGVATQNAYGSSTYTVEVTTLIDSSDTGDGLTEFRIIANMDDGNFVSLDDENGFGYSVDNIHPTPPELTSSEHEDLEVTFHWTYELEDDYREHEVSGLYSTQNTTNNQYSFTLDGHDEHIVQSVDIHGNQSDNSLSILSMYLNGGANLKSFNVLPEDNFVPNVFSSLGTNAIGVITEGGACSQISPGFWVGSQCNILPNRGYWIILSEADVLLFIGSPTNRNFLYELNAGANLISYPYRYAMPTSDALPDDIEGLVTGVITEGGACSQISPGFWVGSQCNFTGGKGYWIIIQEDLSFTFNGCDVQECAGLARIAEAQILDGYEFVQSTNQAFYFIESIENIKSGNWILVYNGDKLIGTRQWQGSIIDVPAMGSDGNEYSDGYMQAGDAPQFKLLSGGKLINLEGDIPTWSDNGLFMVSTLTQVLVPVEYNLSQAYPNPFNPVTTLSFAIPVDSEVSLSIYNLQGREVSTLISGNIEAGYHSVVWNADAYSSGVYFVKMIAGEFVNTQKLMLVK